MSGTLKYHNACSKENVLIMVTPILLGTRRGRLSREFRKLHGEDPVVVGRVVETVLVHRVHRQLSQHLQKFKPYTQIALE